MDDPIRALRRRALKTSLAARGLSYYAASKLSGFSEGTLRNFIDKEIEEKGTKRLGLDIYERISASCQIPIAELLGEASVQIPLVGIVGAGDEIYPFDDGPMGSGLDHIQPPPGCPLDSVAVQVRGDSMFPAYWDGDVLIYRRDGPFNPTTCLYNECVVKVHDGPTLVKRVMPGRAEGTFILESYNAPPLMDQKLDWASPVTYADKTRRGRR